MMASAFRAEHAASRRLLPGCACGRASARNRMTERLRGFPVRPQPLRSSPCVMLSGNTQRPPAGTVDSLPSAHEARQGFPAPRLLDVVKREWQSEMLRVSWVTSETSI